MNLPFYQFLELTLEADDLSCLLQIWNFQICHFFAVLSLLFCFLGFSLSRPTLSALTALGVIFWGMHWLCPLWGLPAGVTFCAVFSVSLAVVSYLCVHLNAMAICGGICADLLFSLLENAALPLWTAAVLIGAAAAAGAAITRLFPLWSLCCFTTLWGSTAFMEWGLDILMPVPASVDLPVRILGSVLLFGAGFSLQLMLYRNQHRFQKIMPDRLRKRLELNRKGSAALA